VERKLWSRLRDRRLCGARFRRQHPIGPFIADFCCTETKLVVELDGGQHGLQKRSDAERTAFLAGQGYRVIRFWDNEALTNTESVLLRIIEALGAKGRVYANVLHGNGLAFTFRSAHPPSNSSNAQDEATPNRANRCCQW